MTTTHTPGPWIPHWNMGDGERHWIVPADQLECRVASVEAWAPTDGDMEAEGKANARLLAAAPDLLEVAKQFMQMNRPRPRISELNRVFELARKAIAKAEGITL